MTRQQLEENVLALAILEMEELAGSIPCAELAADVKDAIEGFLIEIEWEWVENDWSSYHAAQEIEQRMAT